VRKQSKGMLHAGAQLVKNSSSGYMPMCMLMLTPNCSCSSGLSRYHCKRSASGQAFSGQTDFKLLETLPAGMAVTDAFFEEHASRMAWTSLVSGQLHGSHGRQDCTVALADRNTF